MSGELHWPSANRRWRKASAGAAFCVAAAWSTAAGAEVSLAGDERQVRERYERVLLQNPFQERAFQQVFESYLNREGVDQWVETLKPQSATNGIAALLLLGQIHDRQFNPAGAIASLELAARQGESRPEFKALLGSLYYKAGQDERAAELLSSSLDGLADLDRRSSICRILGNLLLRQGKRDEAIKVWKRLAEQSGGEVFSQLELAEIYEDNRLWDEAIAVYRQVAATAKDDPYRRCRALRSIGQCLVQAEKHRDAITVYEEALGLVAPGNWLFEDLKVRLVGVYEDTGDLAGLVRYLQARLEQAPGDLEFHELLAETYTRMGRLDRAEQEHRWVLERHPRAAGVHEKLLALYSRQDKTNEIVAGLEKLIALFPTDTDYVRRLGEAHLHGGDVEMAKATWQRLVKDKPTGERFAELAGWYESFKLPDDAVRAYQQALEKTRNKDWVFRLAALKLERGAEAEAVTLWLSTLDATTSVANDYAEVAAILEASKQIEEAAKLRQQAAAKEPANLEHRLAYARDLMKLEKFAAALAEYSALADQGQNEYLKFQGESGRLDAYAELGVLDDKRQEWERELEQNPRSAQNLVRLARVHERMGQRAKVVQLYERRRRLDPGNVDSLRAVADAYKSARQSQQAVEAFKQLLERDKGRARVYLKDLLEIHLATESKDEAIAAAEQIVALAPSDPEARLELAQVYVLFDAKEKGFEQYRYALRLAPNEPEYHRHYGEALVAEKRWGEAQAAFRKMLDTAQQDQTRLGAVQHLARLYAQQESVDELIAEFQRRVRHTPKKLAAYEELAAIHRETGQSVKAIAVMESGLQAVEEKAPALKSLIRLAHEARNLPKMRSYFEQLIAVSGKPSIPEYERLGSLYAQLGEGDKAQATWDKILELAPKDVKVMKRLSGTMRDEGFAEQSLALRAKAVELAPHDYRLRFEYAQMLASVEQPALALAQLRKLLELGEREPSDQTDGSKEKRARPLARGRTARPNPFLQVQSASRSTFGQRLSTIVSRAASNAPVAPNQLTLAERLSAIASQLAPAAPGATNAALRQIPARAIRTDPAAPAATNAPATARATAITNAPVASSPSSVSPTPVFYSSSGSAFATASWQGAFADFKPQLMAFMAHLARSAGGEDAFVQSYRKPVMENPDHLEAKRELLLALLAFDRQEESLKLAEEILAAAPNDFDVMQMTAQRYTAQRQNAKAIPLLEKLAAEPPYRSQAVLSLVSLYFQEQQSGRSLALADQLLAEHPTEFSVLYSLGSTMLRQGETNRAKSIYERGLTIDPRYRRTFQIALAGLYRQAGDLAQAVAIYKDMLFAAPATPVAIAGSGRTKILYQPQIIAAYATVSSGVRTRRVPPAILGAVDATTNSPLAQLIVLRDAGKSSFDPLAELEQAARKFKASLSPAERSRAWDAARILFTHYFAKEDYGNVSNLLEFLRQAGKEDLEWFNVALYLNQVRENYGGMIALYDELAGRHPAKAREVLLAKTRTFNLARQYEAAAKTIRELNQQPLAAREFLQLVQPFAGGSDRALAKPLLEEYLAAGRRDSEVLALLARVYASDQDYERAIELAGEALDRQPQNRNASPGLSAARMISTASGVVYSSSSPALATDNLVRELHTYHRSAGRSSELIEKARQRLAKQPSSIQLHDTLAQLYSLDGQRDQALEVYQNLTRKFPHLLLPRMSIARLLTEKGEYDKVIALYETLLQSHPEAASQINSLLRSVRQRASR